MIQVAGQPAGAPLPRPTQLQLADLDAHDGLVVNVGQTIVSEQGDGPRLDLSVLENLDGLLPGGLLLVIDFAQVEHVALNDPVTSTTLVFDDAPVTVLLAILLSRAAA